MKNELLNIKEDVEKMMTGTGSSVKDSSIKSHHRK